MSIITERANDPVIKRLLITLAEANVQRIDYEAIKKILIEGADGRYLDYDKFIPLED